MAKIMVKSEVPISADDERMESAMQENRQICEQMQPSQSSMMLVDAIISGYLVPQLPASDMRCDFQPASEATVEPFPYVATHLQLHQFMPPQSISTTICAPNPNDPQHPNNGGHVGTMTTQHVPVPLPQAACSARVGRTMAAVSEAENWSKEETLSLIDLYRERPCLWSAQSEDFKNKKLRKGKMEEMVSAMMNLRPGVTKKELAAKITKLRRQFSAFLKKKRKRRSGSGAKIQKDLWCFKAMEFLTHSVTPRPRVCNSAAAPNPQVEVSSEEDKAGGTVAECSTPSTGRRNTTNEPLMKKKKTDSFFDLAPKSVEKLAGDEDSCTTFGAFVAAELGGVGDSYQKHLARLHIQDVLFKAKNKQLCFPSVTSHPPPAPTNSISASDFLSTYVPSP